MDVVLVLIFGVFMRFFYLVRTNGRIFLFYSATGSRFRLKFGSDSHSRTHKFVIYKLVLL